jgi:hypothetical protein
MRKFTDETLKQNIKAAEKEEKIEFLTFHDEKIDGEIEIVGIKDIFNEPEKLIEAGIIGVNNDLSDKTLKRGDTIYITALIRKKGASLTSPTSQAVIKVRIIDIYNGLSYLNKVINP